jgi:hypothetical protein
MAGFGRNPFQKKLEKMEIFGCEMPVPQALPQVIFEREKNLTNFC